MLRNSAFSITQPVTGIGKSANFDPAISKERDLNLVDYKRAYKLKCHPNTVHGPPSTVGRLPLATRSKQAANLRESNNHSRIQWTGRMRFWAVIGERQVGPGSMINIEVG